MVGRAFARLSCYTSFCCCYINEFVLKLIDSRVMDFMKKLKSVTILYVMSNLDFEEVVLWNFQLSMTYQNFGLT